MPTHSFTLLIDTPEPLLEADIESLIEAGCDDATFGERGSLQYAAFDREASTFAEAVVSSLQTIESTISGARVVRAEPDEFVSITAIARRTHRSREGVRLLADGRRGPGGFPTPERWIDARTTVWHWTEVAEWFEQRLGERVADTADANAIAAINGLLETRRHLVHVDVRPARSALASFVHHDPELRNFLGVSSSNVRGDAATARRKGR